MRSIYIWTTRFILAISLAGILPVPNNSTVLVAQSKKAKASQASKYAKRGSSKAKKKDYRGALSDYKKAYQINPTSNYKKRVQQLTSLAKKQGGKSAAKKPSKKQAAQATAYSKRGASKAKKKDYAGALKDYQRAVKLNPSASNKKRIQQLQTLLKRGNSQVASSSPTKAKVPKISDIPAISPVKYANDIYNIAEAFEHNRIPEDLDASPDEEVMKMLTQIKGVGPWTAEMFLMFTLNRPDVFPATDLGVQKGFQIFHDLDDLPEPSFMIKKAKIWKPYRTLAAHYMWRLVEGPFEW